MAGDYNFDPARTDGSPSGKMDITVPPAATDQQYVAMFYKNNVKVGSSSVFAVN